MANAFGEFVKARRQARGLTLRVFCEKNGFDPGNLSRLERGLTPPPHDEKKLAEYALALGLSERSGWARYDSVQPRYNLLYREIESELLSLCRDQGVGVIVYNPLAGGMLSGKHRPDEPPAAGSRFTLGVSGASA